MSAEIIAAGGEPPELIGGARGIFDVAVDGKVIFSKFAVDRFPEAGEIATLLAASG